MQTIRELVAALTGGKKPVVTFKSGIADKESYAETDMRARIIGATAPDRDGVLRLNFDFAEFDAHNTSFESTTYYDKHQNPVLTARQAGFYKPVDHMYFHLDEPLAALMQLDDPGAMALFEAYTAEGCTYSYVSWLERKLLALMASA